MPNIQQISYKERTHWLQAIFELQFLVYNLFAAMISTPVQWPPFEITDGDGTATQCPAKFCFFLCHSIAYTTSFGQRRFFTT